MNKYNCDECSKEFLRFPSGVCRSKNKFCSRSCGMTFRNKINNPSWTRDMSGNKNPMWGKPNPKLRAWNDTHKGENSPSWKGGVHKRKDGYFRINIKGKRELLHRHLLKDKLSESNVVHHKDGNPSNNDISNLEILESQSEHARLHANLRK